MHCNFICGLSDVIIKTFSQSDGMCDAVEKLKLVGKRRVRPTHSGWLHINVQPRWATSPASCNHRRAATRRRVRRPGRPLALLLRVTELGRAAGGSGGDVRQLVSTPAHCQSDTRPPHAHDGAYACQSASSSSSMMRLASTDYWSCANLHTDGVSPSHLTVIVASDRPWTTLSTRAH